LGDILGKLHGPDLPERSAKDQVQVATNEFSEGVLSM
jgi:hypothetical protein